MDRESASGDPANLQTVERVVRLLQHVIYGQQTVGTRESARVLGISPSSAHRLLRTLDGLGLLVQDETTSEFGPGVELYRLAATLVTSNAVSRAARRPMEKLAAQTGEAVYLCLHHGGQRVVVDTVPGWRPLQYALQLGNTVSLSVGSSGLAILAWLPDEEIETVIKKGLPQYSPRTITNPEELRQTVETTRAQGFATSFGHHTDDGVGVSAPIFGVHSEVIGSLMLTIPATRLDAHGPLLQLGQVVREMADEISLHLGGQPGKRQIERR